jgi:hypothetical protein
MQEGSGYTIADGTAWDLSSVVIGQFCALRFSGQSMPQPLLSSGFITAINDGTDTLTMEGDDIVTLVGGPVTYDVIANDRVVVYDTVEGWWTQYRGMDIHAIDWWRAEQSILTGGESNFVVTGSRYATYKHLEHPDSPGPHFWDNRGNGTEYFTHYFKTNPIAFPDPVIVTAVYIYWDSDSTNSATVTAFLNGESSASISRTVATSEAKRYRFGFHARCRQIEIALSLTPTTDVAAEIERIAIEYRPIRVRK